MSVAAGQDRRARSQRNDDQDRDRTSTALWPQLGAGAKSFEVTAIRPDGTVEPMLWVNNYRAEWPTSYILKEPVALPAGTRLVMTAYYDNATDAALAREGRRCRSLRLPAVSPARNTRTVNGTVDNLSLRRNCSQMR